MSSAAAVVFCVATRHLPATRLTPCQLSLTPTPSPALSTLPSLSGSCLAQCRHPFFFVLFFLDLCPSICPFVFLFFSPHPTASLLTPNPTSHFTTSPRVTSYTSMGLLPPSPSSCLLPCLCFEAVCCGSTNGRVRRKKKTRASLGTCMHGSPGRRQREREVQWNLQSGRSGTFH